jgi:hypothetical protein
MASFRIRTKASRSTRAADPRFAQVGQSLTLYPYRRDHRSMMTARSVASSVRLISKSWPHVAIHLCTAASESRTIGRQAPCAHPATRGR